MSTQSEVEDLGQIIGSDAQSMRSSWIWFVLIGLTAVIGGFISLFSPVVGSFAVVSIVAITFIVMGILQFIQVFQATGWKSKTWLLICAVVLLAGGFLMFKNPLASVVSLSVLVASVLFVFGITKFALGFSLEKDQGRWLVVFSGIVSVILSIMIMTNFPISAVTILGVLLGVELLFDGVSMMGVGFSLKKIPAPAN